VVEESDAKEEKIPRP